MLYLRAYIPAGQIERVEASLEDLPDVRHVVRMGTSASGEVELLSADVDPRAADEVLSLLQQLGIASGEVSLARAEVANPVEAGRQRWLGSSDALVWAEVVDSARENARLFMRYIALMAVAGVIAGIGVVDKNTILIVGAMAVSPDLLPVSAACVGVVGRRPRLVARSVGSLVIGLLVATVTACLVTLFLIWTGTLTKSFALGAGGLGTLPTVNITTAIVAFVAGIAGMVTFETRASSAVGVAISVTTIPAAAYTGAAIAVGAADKATGALAVLGVNVVMLLLGGSITLAVQRWARSEPDRSTSAS